MLMQRLRSFGGRPADEGGSVMISVIAIVVVSISLAVLAMTVERGLNAARTDQSRINAFQHANAGIDLALWRIDRQVFSGGSYAATADGFTDSVVVDGSRFDIVAERTSGTSWTVRSTGLDPSGRERLAIATVAAEPLFHNAFFTVDDFYLTGNQDTPVAYDSATCPTAALSCELAYPVPGRLGTNAEIKGSTATTAAFVARWAGFDMYGRATQAAADDACDSGRCGTSPKVAAIANQLVPDVPDVPSSVLPCPSGGLVNGGTIEPGDYLCASLQLQGTIVIGTAGNGTGRVRIWVDGPFSASSSAVVNRQQRTNKLQVFQEAQEDGQPYAGSICGAEVWALLYTPGLSIDCNGSHQPKMYGAVVAQLHAGTGNHFDFHWDVSSFDVSRDDRYVVRDWRECPVGSSDC